MGNRMATGLAGRLHRAGRGVGWLLLTLFSTTACHRTALVARELVPSPVVQLDRHRPLHLVEGPGGSLRLIVPLERTGPSTARSRAYVLLCDAAAAERPEAAPLAPLAVGVVGQAIPNTAQPDPPGRSSALWQDTLEVAGIRSLLESPRGAPPSSFRLLVRPGGAPGDCGPRTDATDEARYVVDVVPTDGVGGTTASLAGVALVAVLTTLLGVP